MKKIIFIIISLFYIPLVNATSINLESTQTFYPSQGIVESRNINIYGINTNDKQFSLILPEDSNIRFSGDFSSIRVMGSGSYKIGTGMIIESNLRVIKFKLLENLKNTDFINIIGIKLIIYSRPQGDRYIGIDINGDNIIDAYSINGYRVNSIFAYSDKLAPSEIFNFTGSIKDGSITMSADIPGDLDFQGILIENLDNSGKVISSFFRNDLNNLTYELKTNINSIKIKTVDIRAHYSKGLSYNVKQFESKIKIKEKVVNIPEVIKKVVNIPEVIKKVIISKIETYKGNFSNKNRKILNNFISVIDNFILKNKKLDLSIDLENNLIIIRNNIVKELENYDKSLKLSEKKVIINNLSNLIKKLRNNI